MMESNGQVRRWVVPYLLGRRIGHGVGMAGIALLAVALHGGALAGSRTFVMVSNTDCGYGQPQPGGGASAMAGAWAYTGTLVPSLNPAGTTIWQANLAPIGGIEGGAGHVRVIGTGCSPGMTHVDVSLWDLPDYALNNLAQV